VGCLFCFVFESGSSYVAQVDLELLVLLSLPPECWILYVVKGSCWSFIEGMYPGLLENF
jgi:hypothetical protein